MLAECTRERLEHVFAGVIGARPVFERGAAFEVFEAPPVMTPDCVGQCLQQDFNLRFALVLKTEMQLLKKPRIP